MSSKTWDVYLCHAFADKNVIANRLHKALVKEGLNVWYDGAELHMGDDIAAKMQQGLNSSRRILVLITPEFLRNTEGYRFGELAVAYSKTYGSTKSVILPVRYNIDFKALGHHQPLLATMHSEEITNAGAVKGIARRIRTAVAVNDKVQMLHRNGVDTHVGSPDERIGAARHEILVLGIDCKFIVENLSRQFGKALQRGVNISVICAKPSPANSEAAWRIDRFVDGKQFTDSIYSTFRMLSSYDISGHSGKIELRYLPIFPPIGLFIVDRRRPTQSVKAEIYTAKEYGEIDSRPHLIFPGEENIWDDYFINQWENFWQMSEFVVLGK